MLCSPPCCRVKVYVAGEMTMFETRYFRGNRQEMWLRSSKMQWFFFIHIFELGPRDPMTRRNERVCHVTELIIGGIRKRGAQSEFTYQLARFISVKGRVEPSWTSCRLL